MKIWFVGNGRGVVVRVVGEWVWKPENGYMCEVASAADAAALLTEPNGEFVVAEDEPLLAIDGIAAHRAGELALAGVGSLAELAAVDEGGIERLANATPFSARQVRKWVNAARKMTG